MMKLTFLGTGTSQGVPMIACPCEVCHSTDPRDKRLRTSALISVEAFGNGRAGGKIDKRGSGDSGGETINIAIDAGPDFRTQMLAADVRHLDAILLTHEHKDHTGGIDDVRAFNYFDRKPIDIYATCRVQKALRRDYAYAFEEHPYPGAPEIALHTISDEPFRVEARHGQATDGSAETSANEKDASEAVAASVGSVEVIPIRGLHMKLPVTGFRIGSLAYLTDFNHIEDDEIEKLRNLDVLVVNALGHNPHISHFNLDQAVELAGRVGAKRTYLTHMAHRMGLYADIEPTLPEGVHLAYDGLTVTI